MTVCTRTQDTIYIFGVDRSRGDVPEFVKRHAQLIRRVLEAGEGRVLDIGAGRGRFARWIIANMPVRLYAAVEPYEPYLRELIRNAAEAMAQANRMVVLDVSPYPWQRVRDYYMKLDWDVIIAWNVGMFLDLRKTHGTPSFREALVREIACWIRKAKLVLLSFYPVKSGLPEINGFRGDKPDMEIFHRIVAEAVRLADRGRIAAVEKNRNRASFIVSGQP